MSEVIDRAATRIEFSMEAIEALPAAPFGHRDTYHDTRQPSLAVRVTELGKKTFRVRGRPRGTLKVETLTIGPFPAITIEQARAAAAEQLARWARAESIVAARAARQRAEEAKEADAQAMRAVGVKDFRSLAWRARDLGVSVCLPPSGKPLLTEGGVAGRWWFRRINARSCGALRYLDLTEVPETPGVYALYLNQKLVYIGQSERSIRARIKDHLLLVKPEGLRTRFATYWPEPSIAVKWSDGALMGESMFREIRLIVRLNPPLNKVFRRGDAR